MPTPHTELAEEARRIAGNQDARPDVPRCRAVERVGRAACMLLVWDATEPMPTSPKQKTPDRCRERCKAAILDAIGAAGGPLSTKQVIRELAAADLDFGRSTVTKSLADLTKAGQLVNPGDRQGYRLPEWERPELAPKLGQ
jgi:biotin operon repressor